MSFSALPLSYCSNVHPARSVADVVEGIESVSAGAQRLLDFPIAAGLWLPSEVIRELQTNRQGLEAIAQALWQNDLACYTLNTFPFGDFHSARVKETVYLPDWSDPRRKTYTEDCARILAELVPEFGEGSLSTLPLAGTMNRREPGFLEDCLSNLVAAALTLSQIRQDTGRILRLAIEPEPMCELSSTSSSTVPFFEQLFRQASSLGCEDIVRNHVGVCFDVCHQAVEFESIAGSIAQINRAGIRINKVHLTNALELPSPATNDAGRTLLASYVEPRYLHQVAARFGDGSVRWSLDLDAALSDGVASGLDAAETWRIHFHVPVYATKLGPLKTTRIELESAISEVARLPYAPHLEVETYTWPVMPGDEHPMPLAEKVAAELSSASGLIDDASANQQGG
jgi:sugar phosphate isomerase/epimerase